MKVNNAFLGLIIGLLLPFLGDVIVYFILFHSQMTFNEYTQIFKYSHTDAAKAMSLGLLINLIPFIFYTNKRLDNSARGILSATILYFVVIVLLKFVW